MNTLNSFARSSLLRGAPFVTRSYHPTKFTPLKLQPLRNPILSRTVASSVSGRPGSQTLGHAALNIKEEVGNSAIDAAKTIAGGNLEVDYLPTDGKKPSFVCSNPLLLDVYIINSAAGLNILRCQHRSKACARIRSPRRSPISRYFIHSHVPRTASRSCNHWPHHQH